MWKIFFKGLSWLGNSFDINEFSTLKKYIFMKIIQSSVFTRIKFYPNTLLN